jgi:hypothetical protein
MVCQHVLQWSMLWRKGQGATWEPEQGLGEMSGMISLFTHFYPFFFIFPSYFYLTHTLFFTTSYTLTYSHFSNYSPLIYTYPDQSLECHAPATWLVVTDHNRSQPITPHPLLVSMFAFCWKPNMVCILAHALDNLYLTFPSP